MSKKANPTVVGGFVLGAVFLAVAAVLVFGGGKLFTQRPRAVLFFTGSVKGLGIGAPVAYDGVKIGEVADIIMETDLVALQTRIPVIVEFDLERMKIARGEQRETAENLQRWIQGGLRGQLEMQSFVTGQLMVTLNLRPGAPARLWGGYKGLPEIPTLPTPLEQLTETLAELPLRQIVEKISSALDGISKTVNSPEVAGSLSAAERSLKGVEALLTDLRGSLGPMLAKADRTMDDVQKTVRNVDEKVSSLGASAQATIEDTHALVRRFGPVADRLDETLRDTQTLVRRVDGHVDPVLATVQETLRDTGHFVRHTDESLAPVLKKLGEASAAATTALEQATQTMASLGADEPLGHDLTNALREVAAAGRSLRILSDYLEQRPDVLLRGKTQMGGQ